MPYELEYKKVHNTLKPKSLSNVFGYQEGQVVTVLNTVPLGAGSGYKITLSDKKQQCVVKNISDASRTITLNAMSTGDPFPSHPIVKFDNSSTTKTFTLAAGESALVEVPTNKIIYQDGDEKIPVWIGFSCSGGSSNCKLWFTDNDLLSDIDDNNVVISVTKEDPLEVNFLTIDWEEVMDFLNDCELTISQSSNNVVVRIKEGQTSTPSILSTYNFDVVLIPMIYKTNPKPLKSITNMRNIKQTSLYDNKIKKISLYLEPIVITPFITISGDVVSINIFNYHTLPLSSSLFTETASWQGYTTYGLKGTNKAYALDVCKGCGYQEGNEGGTVKICFALGIQKIKAEAPHSGCSVKRYRIFSDQNQIITLQRVALARTDNQNCIINLSN